MPDALDSAFLRRLRFVARFPLPGATERRRIWEGAFPPTVACDALDFAALARLSLTGAVIRNIALGASFRAAGTGAPVGMADVVAAARMELVKLGRPLTEIDGRDWS
jgi:SpoVK/Ycf46/Vps4 family AAA+-type ATPase